MNTTTDRIEKKILLRAPRARVWRALTNPKEFGEWFGVRLTGAFAPGASVHGKITIPEYDHLTLEIRIERMDAQSLFSYRWHPYAIEPDVDYSTEPMTLVTFELADAPGGTMLTIVESGFDGIPLARRAEAYRMNDQGWTQQGMSIERYVNPAK